MSIWNRQVSPADINAMNKNTAAEHMGVVITEIGEDTVTGEMPVDSRTHQPYGLLHGGASVLLAESLGSLGAALAAEKGTKVVGLEINANHLGGVTDGTVVGVASPSHVGRTTHVWDIRIHHKETGKAICVSRITMAVLSA